MGALNESRPLFANDVNENTTDIKCRPQKNSNRHVPFSRA